MRAQEKALARRQIDKRLSVSPQRAFITVWCGHTLTLTVILTNV